MTFHIYNGDKVIETLINQVHIIKSKYRDEGLNKDMDNLKDIVIQCMNDQAHNIEMRGAIKQRINTFRAHELENPDIRRRWSKMEYINIARSIPAITEFLKERYKKSYPQLIEKLQTYNSAINDLKYRTDIIIKNHYSPTRPEEKRFIDETTKKNAQIPLINDEIEEIGILLDMFTSMGDNTVPSTTLQNARTEYRKIEYENTDRKEMQKEFMLDRGE